MPSQQCPKPVKETMVYGLKSADRKGSYVGVTEKLKRRLRQHNKEIKGGAKATGKRVGWKVFFLVTGLPDRKTALQLEWRLHRRSFVHPRGPNPYGKSSAARRAWQLQCALELDRVTKTAPLNATLNPVIHWKRKAHCNIAKALFPANTKHVKWTNKFIS